MAVTLRSYDVLDGHVTGEVTADAGELVPGGSRVLTRAAQRLIGGKVSAEDALGQLDGWSNGRLIWSLTVPDIPAWLREPQPAPVVELDPAMAIGRFDPHELRDPHGKWAKGGGGGGGVEALSPFYNEIPETKGQVRVHAPVPSSGRGREDDAAISIWRKQHPVAPPITKAEARDEARPVSSQQFQELAREGLNKLGMMNASHQPSTGLNKHWDKIKTDTYAKVLQSWGGATIDPRTGEALPDGADAYALTVKSHSMAKVSIPEGSSKATFDAAMEEAKTRFASELEKGSHYLGVFHDDDEGRIDIDPVVVVTSRHDVETIGSYSHAIGGAYHFKTGNGFWPPYVEPELDKAAA